MRRVQKTNYNNMAKFICHTMLILLYTQIWVAHGNNVDSLRQLIIHDKSDTNKVNHLNNLARELNGLNPDSSLLLAKQGLILAQKIHWPKGEARSLVWISWCYILQGNYPQSLANSFAALKIAEKIKNNRLSSSALGNLALVFKQQGNYSQALIYDKKALLISEKANDKYGITRQLANIGLTYLKQKKWNDALPCFLKALKIDKEIDDKNGIALDMEYIGSVYHALKDFKKCEEYYIKAFEMSTALNNKSNIASVLINLGNLNKDFGKFTKAEIHYKKALSLAYEIGSLEQKRLAYKNISSLYDSTGQFALALTHYKKYIAVRDSITNEENTKKQTQMEMQYEFDKVQAADSIKNAERSKQEKLKHNQEIQQQKIYTYGGIGGFALMLVVAIVSFRAFRNKQKANQIIAQQKQLVEEKQREIIDSIHYARRIQQALMPSEKHIQRQLKKKKSS